MSVPIPPGQNSAALADWAETVLAVGSGDGLSHVRIDRLLKGEGSVAADAEFSEDKEKTAPEGAGAEVDVDLEMLGSEAEAERDVRLELLVEQVKLRTTVGERIYPFRAEDDRISRTSSCGEDIYFLLLVLSSADAAFRGDRRAHEVEGAFDQLALEAMRRFIGRGADGVRFARSTDDSGDDASRPGLFSEAIQWLRDQLDVRGRVEPTDQPDEKRHWEWHESYPVPNSYNDGGVDLVVWWRFKDDRQGFPVALVQCTVQISWERKLEDIPLVLWERWIDFSMVPPQRALVIPFSGDPSDGLWRERSLRAGVVIDRVRLLELLNELDCETLASLVGSETSEWVSRELATIG